MHKSLFWLSALLQFEKQLRKERKQQINMAPRQLPGVTLGKHARDWIWLLWSALLASPPSQYKTCVKRSLQDLVYLFSYEYTAGKKGSRGAIVIHAMILVAAETPPMQLNWSSPVYPSESSRMLIERACQNIDIMYKNIKNAFLSRQNVSVDLSRSVQTLRPCQLGKLESSSQNVQNRNRKNSEGILPTPPPQLQTSAAVKTTATATKTKTATAPKTATKTKTKTKKGEMLIASIDKLAIVEAIDLTLFR